MWEWIKSLPPAALATIVAAATSAAVAYLIAAFTATREARKRQSDLSVEVTKLLLDPQRTTAAARRFAVAVLKVVTEEDDDEAGLVLFVPLNSRVTVGRDPSNDVVLSSTYVSRFHCGFVSENRKVFVEDYCSSNHVKVNSDFMKPGTSKLLQDGDIIGIAEHQLRFQAVHFLGVHAPK